MRENCHCQRFRDCGRFWDDLMFGRRICRHRDCDECHHRRRRECDECRRGRKHECDCDKCHHRHRDCDGFRGW